jgi:hypothetical protein
VHGYGELHENLGGTTNYFGQHCQGLLLLILQIASKLPFAPFEVLNSILSKFSLGFFL